MDDRTKKILLKTIWVLLGGRDRGVLINEGEERYVVSADQGMVQIIPEKDIQKDLSFIAEGSLIRFKQQQKIDPEMLKKLN